MRQPLFVQWPEQRLRFVSTINPAAPLRDTLPDDQEVSFLPMEAIGEDGSLRLDLQRTVGELRAGYSYFADGDVAFAKVTPCFENGKGALMRNLAGGHGFGTTELTVLRPGPALDARFLHYFLSSPRFRQPGVGAMTGAGGLKRVPEEFTRNTCIQLPALQIQVRVADYLDRETARIDALIEKKTRFIELLREKRQALITQAVTRGFASGVPMREAHVEWLGKVPTAWTLTRLRDLCDSISTGPFGSSLGNDDYVEDGVPVINPSHIKEDGFAPDPMISVNSDVAARLAYWQLQPGDIVVARRGELGRAAVVSAAEAGWICGTGSLIVRPNTGRVWPELLHAVLQAAYAREWLGLHAVGATMANLNEAILGSLPVAVPPSIDEQAGVVADLNAAIAELSRLRTACLRSIDLLRERRAALITAAVTGQINVPEAA